MAATPVGMVALGAAAPSADTLGGPRLLAGCRNKRAVIGLVAPSGQVSVVGYERMDRRLSEREIQVISLLVAGYSNKEIATSLEISAKTVEFHLTKLYQQSGRAGRVQLAMHAVQSDWLPHTEPA